MTEFASLRNAKRKRRNKSISHWALYFALFLFLHVFVGADDAVVIPHEVIKLPNASGDLVSLDPSRKLPISPKDLLKSTKILVVTTLDGKLHGIDKSDGNVLWSQDGGGIVVCSGTSPTQFKESDSDDESLFEDADSEKSSGNAVYIPEPTDGGNLFVYESGRPIQRLPLPIKELVNMAPFRAGDGTIYLGNKRTRFITLDPYTGEVLHVYGTDGPNLAEECPSEPFEENSRGIYVGRTEYRLSIYDGASRKLKWNITYSEFSATNLDEATLSISADQMHTLDPIRVAASDDAGLVIYNSATDIGHTIKFDQPCISSFNVFSRLKSRGYHLQKVFPISTISGNLQTYIGSINGSLFALSSDKFPRLVEATPESDKDDEIFFCEPEDEDYPYCLVGKSHPYLDPFPTGQTLDGGNAKIEGSEDVYNPRKLQFHMSVVVGKSWEWLRTHPRASLVLAFAVGTLLFGLQFFFSSHFSESETLTVEKRKRGTRGGGRVVRYQEEPVVEPIVTPAALETPEAPHKPRRRRKKHANAENREQEAEHKEEVVELVDTQTVSTLERSTSLPQLHSIVLTPQILGYGSHGTIVYKGTFQGRECAVKRLLMDFYDVAYREVEILQQSDDHPNVVRYFAQEQCDRFLYIALELCPASLSDLVERSKEPSIKELTNQIDPRRALYEMMAGIGYLHGLKMVHRDLKPQNILISNPRPRHAPRVLISDFGLCKKLDDNQSSFHNTIVQPGGGGAGTVGWRAPEVLVAGDNLVVADGDGSTGNQLSSSGQGNRITKAVDIFSAGCVFYYVLTGGEHPFGDRFERESNILRDKYDLDRLDTMGEDGLEAKDLISRMLCHQPKQRATVAEIMTHPFFWTPLKRLTFLQDVSDRFEVEVRDPPSRLLQELESQALEIIGSDWYKNLDRVFLENLGKYRKYDGALIRDLLRALRNKVCPRLYPS
jgi:serine/threonine-protein kinase/endoribonuclease IRE1